jgi:hypothetical protein
MLPPSADIICRRIDDFHFQPMLILHAIFAADEAVSQLRFRRQIFFAEIIFADGFRRDL